MLTEYEITFEDYRNATALYTRVRPFQRFANFTSTWILPGLAVAYFLLWLYVRTYGKLSIQSANLFDNLKPFFAISLVIPLLRKWTIRRAFHTLFPSNKSRIVTFGFAKDGFTYASPDRGEGRFFWSGLYDFAEDSRSFLLFTTKITFIMIPKRAYKAQDWAQLRKLAIEERERQRR